MFDNASLELLIGLAVIFLFFSVVASVLVEWLARLTRLRATILYGSLKCALFGSEISYFVDRVYGHPAIKALAQNDGLPTYISSRTFSLVVTDLAITLTPPHGPGLAGSTTIRRTTNDSTAMPLDASTAKLLETIVFGTFGSMGH